MATITTRVVRNARKKGVVVIRPRAYWSVSIATYAWRRRFRRHSLLPGRPADTLWMHITVTRDTGRTRYSFKKDAFTLEGIGNSRFGTGMSYNAAWDMQTGDIAMGQPFDAAGAHTINDKNIPGYSKNQNYVSVAIAAIGMPGAKPTARALRKLILFIQAMVEEEVLTEDFDFNPHSLVAWKDCPTDAIREVMPQIEAEVKQRPVATHLWVGTLNVKNSMPDEKKNEDHRRLLNQKRLDVALLQEDVSPPNFPSRFAVVKSIAFDASKFMLLDSGRRLISREKFVGDAGAGPKTVPNKYAKWLLLEDRKTGNRFYVVNVHFVASAHLKNRKPLWYEELNNTARLVESFGTRYPVFVGGDFNWNHKAWRIAFRFRKFRQLKMKPNWILGFTTPSHGKRYIDAVWSTLKPRRQFIREGYNSDHNGVNVKYVFKNR